MDEFREHKAYELLKGKFKEIAIDYVILTVDTNHDRVDAYKQAILEGVDAHKQAVLDGIDAHKQTVLDGVDAHKQAVLEAIKILNRDSYDSYITCEPERMKAVSCSMEELLRLPADDYYDTRSKRNRAYSIPKPLPYWAAFLEPPHGVPYNKQDFIDFNRVLFPNIDECVVLRWEDDFSNYFDAGKEWWGTGLWTVFDHSADKIVVIGASLTD